MDKMAVDASPTSGSANLVTSGGVYDAINTLSEGIPSGGEAGQVWTSDGAGAGKWAEPAGGEIKTAKIIMPTGYFEYTLPSDLTRNRTYSTVGHYYAAYATKQGIDFDIASGDSSVAVLSMPTFPYVYFGDYFTNGSDTDYNYYVITTDITEETWADIASKINLTITGNINAIIEVALVAPSIPGGDPKDMAKENNHHHVTLTVESGIVTGGAYKSAPDNSTYSTYLHCNSSRVVPIWPKLVSVTLT